MTYTNRFIGIDISKSSFDICVLPENKSASFSNDASGITQFLACFARLDNVARLVLEPTGGWELPPADMWAVSQPAGWRVQSAGSCRFQWSIVPFKTLK